jgi:hypothetical protein
MPNKSLDKLMVADRWIRKLSPNKGMGSGPQIQITLIRGFELFNTRPYHNYEDWSDGYEIKAFDDNKNVIVSVRREDLDEALQDLETQLSKIKNER